MDGCVVSRSERAEVPFRALTLRTTHPKPGKIRLGLTYARELPEIMAEEYYFAPAQPPVHHPSLAPLRPRVSLAYPLRVMRDTLQVSHYITKDTVIPAAL